MNTLERSRAWLLYFAKFNLNGPALLRGPWCQGGLWFEQDRCGKRTPFYSSSGWPRRRPARSGAGRPGAGAYRDLL